MSSGEFFDLAELPLNRSGQAWGNLGYWPSATDYSAACRDLAMLLGERLELNSESVVLDAGFGCGDQLLLWLQKFQIHQLFGVNYSESQTNYARSRISQLGRDSRVNIRSGCVDQSEIWTLAAGQGVNRVVALDCAYHFPSRQNFFRQAYQLLGDSGRIGLTDIVLGEGYRGLAGCAGAMMFRLSQIPRRNRVTKAQYCAQLEEAGFSGVEVEDISVQVMPEFRRWLQGFKADNPGLMSRQSWLKYDVTARFLNWAYRQEALKYVVVRAQK